MRAVRYYGPGDVRLDEITEPVVKEGQVKIKVNLCSPYDDKR